MALPESTMGGVPTYCTMSPPSLFVMWDETTFEPTCTKVRPLPLRRICWLMERTTRFSST